MINMKNEEKSKLKQEILIELSKSADELRNLGVLVDIPGYDEIQIVERGCEKIER